MISDQTRHYGDIKSHAIGDIHLKGDNRHTSGLLVSSFIDSRKHISTITHRFFSLVVTGSSSYPQRCGQPCRGSIPY